MFRDQIQRAAVCRQICELGGCVGYWDLNGPTQKAMSERQIWRVSQGALKQEIGQAVGHLHLAVQAAWQAWDGSGSYERAQAQDTLLGRAVRALSSTAPDTWLLKYDPQLITGNEWAAVG